MTTPVSMPEIVTYSLVSNGTAVSFPRFGQYLPLYTGLQTISVTARGGTGSVHLSTRPGFKARYLTRKIEDGQTVVLSNVARPEGENRYLSFFSDTESDTEMDGVDYSVMIIKY